MLWHKIKNPTWVRCIRTLMGIYFPSSSPFFDSIPVEDNWWVFCLLDLQTFCSHIIHQHSLFSFLWIWPAFVFISSRRVWSSFFIPDPRPKQHVQHVSSYQTTWADFVQFQVLVRHFMDMINTQIWTDWRPKRTHSLSSGSATPSTVFCLFSRSDTIFLSMLSPSWISCT